MSMVENFLAEVYQKLRSKQVAIVIDGECLSSQLLPKLPILREKVKELGEIRIAEVVFENNIPKKEFEYLRQSGFTDIIVPGNIELSFLLEIYDMVLEEKVDFLILGTHHDELIPLFTEIRKNVTAFALVDSKKKVSKAFIESFDGIIEVDTLDEFIFNDAQFSEINQLIAQSKNGSLGNGESSHSTSSDELISDYTGDVEPIIDESNIGTFSEDIIENEEILEEMKKERKKK